MTDLIERLREGCSNHPFCDGCQDERSDAADMIERLNEALKFYADEENYSPDDGSVGKLVTTGWNADRMEECEEWEWDMGEIARAAIGDKG